MNDTSPRIRLSIWLLALATLWWVSSAPGDAWAQKAPERRMLSDLDSEIQKPNAVQHDKVDTAIGQAAALSDYESTLDLSVVSAPAPKQDAVADRLLFESDQARVKFNVDAVLQQSGVTGSWWNLSGSFAPEADYKLDRAWAESWIKPGVRVDFNTDDRLSLYAGLSYVGSGNIGRDVFEQGNRGLVSVEDAYLGMRYKLPDDRSTLDFSYGRQPYKIGSGMLVSVGAMNGFERGATTTFARRAWEEAGVVRWTRGRVSLDGFYLDPNELRTSDTSTRLAGSKLEWNPGPKQTLGVAFFNVFESTFPYVAAPVQFLPNGREGLNTVQVYRNWSPLPELVPNWTLSADYAHQWNDGIAMTADAFSGESSYSFAQLPFMPKLGYTFRSFSGDDPTTSEFEKFDPLFYEGAPPLWATGSNGSFNFLNSNLIAHRISLNLTINPQNFMNFYYWRIHAEEVNSPLQFGQAGRIVTSGGEPELVSGVPDSHLSDDFYIEYTRVISSHVFLTTGVAISVPGQGLESLIADPKTWTGGLINVTVKY